MVQGNEVLAWHLAHVTGSWARQIATGFGALDHLMARAPGNWALQFKLIQLDGNGTMALEMARVLARRLGQWHMGVFFAIFPDFWAWQFGLSYNSGCTFGWARKKKGCWISDWAKLSLLFSISPWWVRLGSLLDLSGSHKPP